MWKMGVVGKKSLKKDFNNLWVTSLKPFRERGLIEVLVMSPLSLRGFLLSNIGLDSGKLHSLYSKVCT